MALNPRQQKFVTEYVHGKSAAEAYRAAGYLCRNEGSAKANAARLIAKDNVSAAIKDAQARLRADQAVTDREILEGFKSEALNKEGCRGSERISAWVELAKLRGMYKRAELQVELEALDTFDESGSQKMPTRAPPAEGGAGTSGTS